MTKQICKIYYLAQTSQKQCELVKENEQRMDSLYSITEALYNQGLVLSTDLGRVGINLKNMRSLYENYQTLHKQQLNMLRYMLDMDLNAPLAVEPLTQNVKDEQYKGIDTNLPELRLANSQIHLIDRKIKAVKAAYIPSVSLFGQIGATGFHDRFHQIFHGKESHQNWFESYYFGLSVKIPIFDGRTKYLKIQELKYEKEQMVNNDSELKLRLNRDYDNAVLQLRQSESEFYTQQDNCEQAQKVYDVTIVQYKEGVASMTELLQDEMNLLNAQSACVQAHYRYRLARLELLDLSGLLTDEIYE